MDGPTEGHDLRPLPVLRALIDAVDREMLQLLARRNGLVGEIARYKREHRLAIRDSGRERELIGDRRRRSEPLGLSPDVVESIFRLVLWASRDRQAALKAEVPPGVEPRAVAVIGGRGAMGRCMAELFADLGHAVMVADVDTELTPAEAAANADVVIVSVPIERTVPLIREIGPRVPSDSVLMDVTSIKAEPVAAMLESTNASVVGTHPLFGPSVHSLQGQRIVVTPGRGEAWLEWIETMLHARGLIIKRCAPEEHDRAMAVVQVLTHLTTEVWGNALRRLDVPIEQTLEFTSPVYLMELIMAGRHFGQSARLYASIQMSNPLRGRVTEAFLEAAREHKTIIDDGDVDGLEQTFDAVREFLGPFTEQAIEKSSFLIDRLVERM